MPASAINPAGRPVSRLMPGVVKILALALLGATIAIVTLSLRGTLQEQMISRESEALNAVISLKLLEAEEDPAFIGSESVIDLMTHILETSRMAEVLGVRLFTETGEPQIAFPPTLTDARLPAGLLPRLQAFELVEDYDPAAKVEELTSEPAASGQTTPALYVWIPLKHPAENRLFGIAEYILDAHALKAKLAETDEHLFRHASGIFAVGAIVLLIGLHYAFSRLQRANALLEERTRSLQRANDELVLNAKTSALGAVTAHLLHGLKNPLSGLQYFVNAREIVSGDTEYWESAAASTRRMHDMIQEIMRILQEENSGQIYDLTLEEISGVVRQKVAPHAEEAGVAFESIVTGGAVISNRQANLIALILQNLVDNAIQASPKGGKVTLFAASQGEGLLFQVRDEGPGISEESQKHLFVPGRTSKEGGSGLGLAISKQLADKLGAELALENTSPRGSTFQLRIPAGILTDSVPTA